MPNSVLIGQIIAEIWRFSIFKWRPFTLVLLRRYLDHPRWVFGGIYHCANFGSNWCSSVDNMQLLIF